MDDQRTSAEAMLDSSQRVREQLLAAVQRLDSYIDLLQAELTINAAGESQSGEQSH